MMNGLLMRALDPDEEGEDAAPGGRRPVLPARWRHMLELLEYAFQPVVQMRTGRCHGVEALLRGFDRMSLLGIPYQNPHEFLDGAFAEGVLPAVEAALHDKAVEAYRALEGWRGGKLFLNIDARLVGQPGSDALLAGLHRDGLGINLEISERSDLTADGVEQAIERYRAAGLGVALDDFGVGYAGLRLLYEAKPDYVKIDRFFIAGIDRDMRKRAIAHSLVGYAHTLGILIIAEGIETEKEFYTCRDLGCDFAQGYLICKPRLDFTELPGRFSVVEDLNHRDRRQKTEAHRLSEVIERLPPLPVDSRKTELLDYFRDDDSPPVAPVVDGHRRPLGLIRERDLKRFVYSRFGSELLRNRGIGDTLKHLVYKGPVCDISTPLDRVIEAFSAEEAADGIIIIEGGEYAGFLSSAALVRLVHERNLAMAADQNPLTRLPGNAAIVRHIEQALQDRSCSHLLVYLDFDNFKPFNDHFGFRQGDRAILMFAERLKAWAAVGKGFAGHIGGDDFFLGVSDGDEAEVLGRVAELLALFRSDAESLYDPKMREEGGFLAKDRYGNTRRFPLLSVSGVAVSIAPGAHGLTPDVINAAIAGCKCDAKTSPTKLCVVRPGE
ncbi:GGDEF domain-containing protein [Azospirillum sp. SYSU D00513]|uniref:GGDEF domain-containing protein n=1 Tax=Azospirillum sp. SYSU D00513 TaxID=2812561 RepID=UPI001FFEC7FA|nr:GGDEF domain-containing protein [Azospirillum sp. SYSU D00513]